MSSAYSEEIHHEEEQFRLLIEGVKDYAIFLIDPSGFIKSWNAGAERIKGYTANEIIGKHYSIFFQKRDVEEGKPDYILKVAAKDGKYEEEGWRIRKNGIVFWAGVTITALRDSKGTLLGYAKITRDLTTQKQTEEYLKETQERYKLLINSVKDYAIFLLDTRGRVKSWNYGAEKILGYQAQEILGEHFILFYPREDISTGKPSTELQTAIDTGRFEEEGFRVRKDGTKFWANVILSKIEDEQGHLIGFSKVVRDITERKKIFEDALKIRDDFLSIASHELKTPLAMLKLQLQLAKRGVKPETDEVPTAHVLTQTYDEAIKKVNLLAGLVEELLDITRINIGTFYLNLEKLDLSKIVSESVGRFSQLLDKAQCTVQLDLEKNIIGYFDKFRIEQIFSNLMANIIKYASKCTAKISLRLQDKETALLIVEDNGPGIPKKDQNKIFQCYEKAGSKSVDGLGLGLYIVKEIVNAHQGIISIDSDIGKGTKFMIELPLMPKENIKEIK